MSISYVMAAARSALADKRGAAMIEYALLVGLIAIVAAAALTTLGGNVKGAFTAMSTSI